MALFKNVTATYNSVAIADVKGADISLEGERIVHSADQDSFLTYQAFVKKDRTITVHTDDLSDAFGLTQGATAATLSVVAKTGDGGSDLTFSGSFMVGNISGGVGHATFDNDCAIPFHAVSVDGSTDPLSVS